MPIELPLNVLPAPAQSLPSTEGNAASAIVDDDIILDGNEVGAVEEIPSPQIVADEIASPAVPTEPPFAPLKLMPAEFPRSRAIGPCADFIVVNICGTDDRNALPGIANNDISCSGCGCANLNDVAEDFDTVAVPAGVPSGATQGNYSLRPTHCWH